MDRPSTRPYARIERERRFALDALPAAVDPGDYERLVDLYLRDTELRLRRVEAPDGTRKQVKLGQKTPDPDAPADPRRRRMTTLYLRPGDEALFVDLPGRRSVKRRYRLRDQGHVFCIDVYEEPPGAAGVLVCEVESESDDDLDGLRCPTWAREEVTADPAYSGFTLAGRLGES